MLDVGCWLQYHRISLNYGKPPDPVIDRPLLLLLLLLLLLVFLLVFLAELKGQAKSAECARIH